MRFLKLAAISVAVLFTLLTAISLLIPSTVVISRSVDIEVSVEGMLPLLNDLSEWRAWIGNSDTSAIRVSKLSKTPGALLSADNTIIRLDYSDAGQVKTTWRSGEGQSIACSFYLQSRQADSACIMQWQFTRTLKWYPWQKFSAIASEKVLGPYIEEKLKDIKAIAESGK